MRWGIYLRENVRMVIEGITYANNNDGILELYDEEGEVVAFYTLKKILSAGKICDCQYHSEENDEEHEGEFIDNSDISA